MRINKALSFIGLFLFQIQAQAFQPVSGWYAGVFLGPSATPSSNFDFGAPITFTGSNATISADSGSIKHSVLGGVGGQVGYRFCLKHRVEAEWYYNNNPIKSLQLNNFTATNTYAPTFNVSNTTLQLKGSSNTSNAYIQGGTNTGAVLFNFIYDFFSASNDGYNKVVPFVGLGVGYSYVQNAMQVYRATTVDPANDPNPNREVLSVLQNRYIYAGQAMLGVNYFLDDFTWFGLDLRYFSTGSSTVSSRYTYISPTATQTVSNTTSLFGKRTEIVSVNLSFSGAFNFG